VLVLAVVVILVSPSLAGARSGPAAVIATGSFVFSGDCG